MKLKSQIEISKMCEEEIEEEMTSWKSLIPNIENRVKTGELSQALLDAILEYIDALEYCLPKIQKSTAIITTHYEYVKAMNIEEMVQGSSELEVEVIDGTESSKSEDYSEMFSEESVAAAKKEAAKAEQKLRELEKKGKKKSSSRKNRCALL